ncbi:hypothetical protein HK101_010077 [Irineochytrium annulatum]|nr:hypothetical protein HK101_010077 [Irineochytrium annulatum]
MSTTIASSSCSKSCSNGNGASSRPHVLNQTPFRIVERAFKRKILKKGEQDPASQFKVLDAHRFSTGGETGDELRRIRIPAPKFPQHENLAPVGEIDAFTFRAHPGLVLIPNPFTPSAQRHIVKSCMRHWAKRPNVSNLDTHYVIPGEGLWYLYERDWASGSLTQLQRRPPAEADAYEMEYNDPEGAQTLKFDPPTSEVLHLSPHLPVSLALKKWRWSSLGYQYNWHTQDYHMDRNASIPVEVTDLCRAVIEAVAGVTGYAVDKYNPEAGIINFYQLGDSLTAHQDRSEVNRDAPLVSFSFGNECIFLFGAETREEAAPTPIRLRSGDIIVMSGVSRRCFHGVPRVLKNTLPDFLKADDVDMAVRDEDWDIFAEFMQTTRINLNIRQVF